jgi:ABC-2 type transport system permease protein
MANNAGSFLFGLIYITLWHAASRGRTLGPFHARELMSYIALSQAVLWISTFLPDGLDIPRQVRTGSIALEMARPVAYAPRMLADGVGQALYNLVFRSGPLIVGFTLMGVFPWRALIAGPRPVWVLSALAASLLMGVLFQYLIGISAFWTIESRWARRLFMGLTVLMSGQLLPIQLMPAFLRHLLVWLPFQALVSLPVSAWLGVASPEGWISAAGWALVLYGLVRWITARARRRLEVQGG